MDTNGQADKERIHVLVNGGTFKYFNQPGADTGGGGGTFAPALNLEFYVPIFRIASQ